MFQVAVQHEILKRLYTVLYYRFLEGWAGWKEMMVTRGKTAIGDKKKKPFSKYETTYK